MARAVLLAAGLLATAAAASPPLTADRVVVLKARHEIWLYANGRPLAHFAVALGSGGLARKQRQGDRLVPEGRYTIAARNAASHYYKSLRISYPSAAQAMAARRAGYDAGGDVMIHGLPNGRGWIGAAHRLHDWTWGCVAVTDEEMDQIWRTVPIGTPIEIRP